MLTTNEEIGDKISFILASIELPKANFGRNISSRQFYTNPSTTIPNDQESFAKWCYGDMPSCKDGQNCLRYEDLRQKRGPANEEVINQFTYNKQD